MDQSPEPSSDRPGLLRRRFSPTGLRRCLFVLACLMTLVAIFYAEENWRGKRAWEKCRRELEAKGEVLDWNAYIPAPVPDDQNFFKAPKMQEWFVRNSWQDFAAPQRVKATNAPQPFAIAPRKDTNLLVAEVTVLPSTAPPDSLPADAVLRFDDPAARDEAAKLLRERLGPCAIGSRMCVLIARPLETIKPLHLALRADPVPTAKELASYFPANPLTNSSLAPSGVSYFRVDPAGSNTFRLTLKEPVYGAADYLTWTGPQSADFDLIRKALERPYARMDGDYQQPFATAIPNFVRIRDVAQTLSQRTQCYLLLGQPEAAWHELALVRDLCRILEPRPADRRVLLVEAMINTAVTGLYAGIIEDGLRLHAWREPQLLALERQLKEADLLSQLVASFRGERAAACHTFATYTPGELEKLFGFARGTHTLGDKFSSLSSVLGLMAMPRGWYYQNMVVTAGTLQEVLASIDPTNQLVLPHQAGQYLRELMLRYHYRTPYTVLAFVAAPNLSRALQTVAFNQTLVNQARVACALERYRLAHGQYPDTLDTLVPQFIEKLPHDIIGGQPLKYRRTDGRGYLLYSIGWSEKDNGGVPGKTREEGDWVWGCPVR